MQSAVFLDRDGVINRADVRNGRPYAPLSVERLEILPGVAESMNALRAAGFKLIVVTNQPDVAAGAVSREAVEGINDRLVRELPIDDIRTCYHNDADNCTCRKPAPGLLLDAAQDWNIDLASSFMVGDRWRDVGAGKAAGCFTLFIDHGYTERAPGPCDAIVGSLREAADVILEQIGGAHGGGARPDSIRTVR